MPLPTMAKEFSLGPSQQSPQSIGFSRAGITNQPGLPLPRRGPTDKKTAQNDQEGPTLSTLRPIQDDERPYLAALGTELTRLRQDAGLTRYQLAYASLLSAGHLAHLLYGCRRTRRSTLARMVDALVKANPDLGPVDALLEHLCDLAGPALAPESAYPQRVARTLRRRAKRRERGMWHP
jgi:hypothetical protein